MNKQVEMAQERATGIFGKVSGMARKVVFLSLGTADFVREEVTDLINDGVLFTNRLVERGETVVKDGRERARDRAANLVEKPQARAQEATRKVEESFDRYTEQVLSRLNVPTSREIDAVDKKLTSLNRKLDRIAKAETEEIQVVDRKLENMNRKLNEVVKAEAN